MINIRAVLRVAAMVAATVLLVVGVSTDAVVKAQSGYPQHSVASMLKVIRLEQVPSCAARYCYHISGKPASGEVYFYSYGGPQQADDPAFAPLIRVTAWGLHQVSDAWGNLLPSNPE